MRCIGVELQAFARRGILRDYTAQSARQRSVDWSAAVDWVEVERLVEVWDLFLERLPCVGLLFGWHNISVGLEVDITV